MELLLKQALPQNSMRMDSYIANWLIFNDMSSKGEAGEALAVTRFREYLRINTEQPTPNYRECEKFLHNYAKEIG
uniref:Uncharacterized protein n=1 Tax=Ditylenchus dipsaci TaxID=166011 RepID=A0A915CUQ2_9BILA